MKLDSTAIREIPKVADKKDLMANLSDDEKTVLKIIYEDDLPMASMNSYVERLLKENTFKRVKIQSLLTSLSEKGLISLSSGYYDTSDKGRKIMLELFDKK
jgi:predicted transcriptional regulator